MKKTIAALFILSTTLLGACSDDSDNGLAVPAQPLLPRYVLSSQDSIPEGVAFDPVERAFYASSLQGASITKIAANGDESIFKAADGNGRLVGIKVDANKRRLWVCATRTDPAQNRVQVYNLQTAELAQEYLLGAITTGGSCNDLVLDDTGTAYVTDPANPYIYKLNPGSGEGEIFATDPLFDDITGFGLGLNGIAISADGSALIVARFAPAALLRVSLPDGDNIADIALAGDTTLPAPDGLAVLGGDVYAVSDSAVSRIRLNADNSAGDVVVVPQISGLSTATVADDALYVIKSEVTNFVVGGTLNTPFEIFSVDLTAFGP